MNMTFFTLIYCKKLYCLFDKTENKRITGRDWHIFSKKMTFEIYFRNKNGFSIQCLPNFYLSFITRNKPISSSKVRQEYLLLKKKQF